MRVPETFETAISCLGDPGLSKTGAVREASEAARAGCGSGSGSSGGAAEDMPSGGKALLTSTESFSA